MAHRDGRHCFGKLLAMYCVTGHGAKCIFYSGFHKFCDSNGYNPTPFSL